jgi:hypothetical protein
MSDRAPSLASGVTLLPAPACSFRTWYPSRGPIRSLIKTGPPGDLYWLTGPPAALWGALEGGLTLGRLRRRAQALEVSDPLESLLLEWRQAGLIEVRGSAPSDGPTETSESASATASLCPASLRPASLSEAQHWTRSQGLAFSARWALDQPVRDLREAIERLDFLRRSGVFQVCFTINTPGDRGTVPRILDPHHEHIRLAARAQGFECVGPDEDVGISSD